MCVSARTSISTETNEEGDVSILNLVHGRKTHTETHTHADTHTHPHSHTGPFFSALTVTDALADDAPHASGKVWRRGFPSLSSRPEPQQLADVHIKKKPHANLMTGLRAHARTRQRASSRFHPEEEQVPAFSFILALRFNPPSVSLLPPTLLLPWAASQPIRREVTSWCCSQCGGSTVCVCVCQRKRERETRTHLRNINWALLCPWHRSSLSNTHTRTHAHLHSTKHIQMIDD